MPSLQDLVLLLNVNGQYIQSNSGPLVILGIIIDKRTANINNEISSLAQKIKATDFLSIFLLFKLLEPSFIYATRIFYKKPSPRPSSSLFLDLF